MNNMAKLPFELSVPITRARLKPLRVTCQSEFGIELNISRQVPSGSVAAKRDVRHELLPA